jgi:hypothetical protein
MTELLTTRRRTPAKNRQAEIAGKALARNIVTITNGMINKALEGDAKAAEWCASRVFPKERLVKFEMMKIEKPEDVQTAVAGFINAVALGILSVNEAERLVNMASKLGDAIDATEHADIMRQLADKAGIPINDAL